MVRVSIFRSLFAALLLGPVSPLTLASTEVRYSVAELGGGFWRYDYTVLNTGLGDGVYDLDVFFDVDMTVLPPASGTAPAGWFTDLTVGTDDFLGEDGIYIAYTFDQPIAPGGSLGGFSATFEYLGEGTPGPQEYGIWDEATLDYIDFGLTAPVPLPAGAWLLLSGVLALFVRRC